MIYKTLHRKLKIEQHGPYIALILIGSLLIRMRGAIVVLFICMRGAIVVLFICMRANELL
jgi:hypothetical protein